jgi:hypothetical protein
VLLLPDVPGHLRRGRYCLPRGQGRRHSGAHGPAAAFNGTNHAADDGKRSHHDGASLGVPIVLLGLVIAAPFPSF